MRRLRRGYVPKSQSLNFIPCITSDHVLTAFHSKLVAMLARSYFDVSYNSSVAFSGENVCAKTDENAVPKCRSKPVVLGHSPYFTDILEVP